MTNIFIDGQAGTTGLQIAQRISARNDLTLLSIADSDRKKDAARAQLMHAADVTILCLPDAAVSQACELAAGNTRLLDASSVHRTNPDWVYGLPELGTQQRQAIANSARVSNPGCYPQGFILCVRPLIDSGLLPANTPLAMHAVSGYSGGGRSMIEHYQAMSDQVREAQTVRAYGLTLDHKHVPEMHQFSGAAQAPVFVPMVASYYQGMLTQVALLRSQLPDLADPKQIVDLLRDRYKDEPFIQVHDLQATAAQDNGFLDATNCNNTNRLEIMVFANSERLLLAARYDNLGKGAAGCAIQNLNLMLGLDEAQGLDI